MGQYYRIAFKHEGKRAVVNDRKVEGDDYCMAKLLEHSWLGCHIALQPAPGPAERSLHLPPQVRGRCAARLHLTLAFCKLINTDVTC